MQKGDALHPFSLARALRRRTYRLRAGGLVPVGLRSAIIITTGTAVTARTFRTRRSFMAARSVHARSGSCTPVLRRRRSGLAMTRRTPVFLGQGDPDQLFDVAEIGQFLAAGDERDGDPVGARPRGAADAM